MYKSYILAFFCLILCYSTSIAQQDTILVSGQTLRIDSSGQMEVKYRPGIPIVDNISIDTVQYYMLLSTLYDMEKEYFEKSYSGAALTSNRMDTLLSTSDSLNRYKNTDEKIGEDMWQQSYYNIAQTIIKTRSHMSSALPESKQFLDALCLQFNIIQPQIDEIYIDTLALTVDTLQVSNNNIVSLNPQLKDASEEKSISCAYSTIDKDGTKEVCSSDFFLFSHLPDYIAQYNNPGPPIIEMKVQIVQKRSKTYLRGSVYLRSQQVAKSYGRILPKALIKCSFLNNVDKVLTVSTSNEPFIEPYTGRVKMIFDVLLDKEMIKILQDKYLDSVGIQWSSGYEMYNIFFVDAIRESFSCLQQNP